MDVRVFVTVIPEEGQLSTIAKALLAVADHPYDVQMVSHPHKAFRVPEDLFDRFQATQEPEVEVAQPVASKRRGRPRKVVVAEEKPEVVVPPVDPRQAAEVLAGVKPEEEVGAS